MLKKAIYLIALIALTTSEVPAQRSMVVGDVELRLGMPQGAVVKLLSDYHLTVSGSGFNVLKYNKSKKLYDLFGAVGFEQDQLSYISRMIDTEGWPTDEGFSVGRAIYDALNSSIGRTDTDGAKRASAIIVISNQDAAKPTRMNIRSIDIYLNDQKIILTIVDGSDGKSVSGQVDIRSKPW